MVTFQNVLTSINDLISLKRIGLKKRFQLFLIITNAFAKITEDSFLTFETLLKSYKVLGKVLSRDINYFYKNRNKFWFKNFFVERKLYELVKNDIERLHKKYGHIRVLMTKRGILVYNNYKKNNFNVLLMTIHNGTWVDSFVEQKMDLTEKLRYRDEDVGTGMLYCDIVLKKGGIWIDNKQSRFACDFNRHISRAIYTNKSEKMVKKIWKEELKESEKKKILESYREFYFTLTRLLDTHRFNIIFDAHSMRHKPRRPIISFGIKYVPLFYIPIVKNLRVKLKKLGYRDIKINKPYKGGYILKFLSNKFPDVFIFSMEVNKKLYMDKKCLKIYQRKTKKVSQDISQLFDAA